MLGHTVNDVYSAPSIVTLPKAAASAGLALSPFITKPHWTINPGARLAPSTVTLKSPLNGRSITPEPPNASWNPLLGSSALMKYLAVYLFKSRVWSVTVPLKVRSCPFNPAGSIRVLASMILLPPPLPSDQNPSLAL